MTRRTIEVVAATRDSQEDAWLKKQELQRKHPYRTYAVCETRMMLNRPRTRDRWCVMERREVAG